MPQNEGEALDMREWDYEAGLERAFASQMQAGRPDLTSAGNWCAALLRLRMIDAAIGRKEINEVSELRVRQMKIADVVYKKFVAPFIRVKGADVGPSSVSMAPSDIVYLLHVRNDIAEFAKSHPGPLAEALNRSRFSYVEVLDIIVDSWASRGSPPEHILDLRGAILWDSVSGRPWHELYRCTHMGGGTQLRLENPDNGTVWQFKWDNVQ